MLFLDTIQPPSWSTLLTGLGVLTFLGGAFYFNWRRGTEQAGDRALAKYKSLAEATQTDNDRLTKENGELTATVAAQKAELKSCDDFRNDVARAFLRAEARERKYQTCINNLEVALHMRPTNFDDPTVHITEGFDRR
jgi:hypothetical protein